LNAAWSHSKKTLPQKGRGYGENPLCSLSSRGAVAAKIADPLVK
jgi:hypothetical protein